MWQNRNRTQYRCRENDRRELDPWIQAGTQEELPVSKRTDSRKGDGNF